jgi:hypothetical protein
MSEAPLGGLLFERARKADAVNLLNKRHYIGAQCADPAHVFVWRLADQPERPVCAAALFAPPASFAWGRNALELVRLVKDDVAVKPLSSFLAKCVAFIKKQGRYELLVSYADPGAGHHGGVYQACSWLYVGRSSAKYVYIHKKTGKRASQRSFDQSNYDPADWHRVRTARKHTYVLPLSRDAKAKWLPRHAPYPKPWAATPSYLEADVFA